MSTTATDWFSVDKTGLSKLLEKRGKQFLLYELISNVWDTSARTCTVEIGMVEGSRTLADIYVEDDDPDGFKNLAHAFTLFAESDKKGDPTKRGRFNLGEKLVLAMCQEADIITTTGTVTFNKEGRVHKRGRRAHGSIFNAIIRMTKDELGTVLAALKILIPPETCTTTINGETLLPRKPLRVVEHIALPTEISDETGALRRTKRQTFVRIFEPLPGETPTLYEMGVPVVETEDVYHVDVAQKVPLNMERDNVTPAYLRQIRTIVVNAMRDDLQPEHANSALVREAAASPDVDPEAMRKIMDLRFGTKRVAFDPSDLEANNRAVAMGYTVVYGSMMGKEEWTNARAAQAILPAGQVTPTPSPFGDGEGQPVNIIPEEEWTDEMHQVVAYSKWLAKKLMDVTVRVDIHRESKQPYSAAYGRDGAYSGHLMFNYGRLGKAFFASGLTPKLNALLVHEFAHHESCNHLSEEYYDALCDLAGKLADLALREPDAMRGFFAKD